MNQASFSVQINSNGTQEEAMPTVSYANPTIHSTAADATRDAAAITTLIEAFHHHHPAVRSAAVDELIKLGSITVNLLIAAYDDSQDQGFQAQIIQVLAQIGDAKALNLLAEVVGTSVANHCQGNVRRIAARGLGKIASTTSNTEIINNAQEKLIWALLTPEDWGLRYAAAVSLQEIATPKAKAALQQAIAQETDPVVRTRMAIALSEEARERN